MADATEPTGRERLWPAIVSAGISPTRAWALRSVLTGRDGRPLTRRTVSSSPAAAALIRLELALERSHGAH